MTYLGEGSAHIGGQQRRFYYTPQYHMYEYK